LEQWYLKITRYSEELLEDLKTLEDWPARVITMQDNWIGKSYGVEIFFREKETDTRIPVFTTRPDTIFGATYMVLSPEHPLLDLLVTEKNRKAVVEYQKKASLKSDRERGIEKEKTGLFTGALVVNPATKKEIQVWVADYVLMGYGTGAIMAVPGQDERDWEFAEKFQLPIVRTVQPPDDFTGKAYLGDGPAMNSGFLNGLKVESAKKKIIEWLEEEGIGQSKVNYKLRDWLFSRQRYWGEPFPIIHMEDGSIKLLDESELPLTLPEVDDFRPSGTGESPLANSSDWLIYTDPKTGKKGRRETNTMPQWAGSCWYYLRYIDPNNDIEAWAKDKEKYWMPVDLYVGGAEHAVLHLLYARFWHKVLYDLGFVSTKEPFKKLINQGMILGLSYKDARGSIVPTNKVKNINGKFYNEESGEELIEFPAKMSKSLKNVVNPDDVISQYGSDSMRLYEMFMGPLEATKPWNTTGVEGVYRFLKKAWRMINGFEFADIELDRKQLVVLHSTIKKVSEDTESLNFNTAISQMMVFVNEFGKLSKVPKYAAQVFAKLISPYAPHLGEEMWAILGHNNSIAYEPWPKYQEEYLKEDEVEVLIQILGKPKARMMLSPEASENEMREAAFKNHDVISALAGKTVRKVICVPGRLVNIVAN